MRSPVLAAQTFDRASLPPPFSLGQPEATLGATSWRDSRVCCSTRQKYSKNDAFVEIRDKKEEGKAIKSPSAQILEVTTTRWTEEKVIGPACRTNGRTPSSQQQSRWPKNRPAFSCGIGRETKTSVKSGFPPPDRTQLLRDARVSVLNDETFRGRKGPRRLAPPIRSKTTTPTTENFSTRGASSYQPTPDILAVTGPGNETREPRKSRKSVI
ncbi:hypothetical protein GWI33_005071 [Rhynchophorus ferrugineus]|uniref:Uncharacterized protein n=1 Tax=Rhynchophorus ferrugineus TaxID=354439 RepID=A0A834MK13_RHYFE|nr:hypothetical protein GWI33_005071 [Rhynchophorus ferrugineus]